MYFDSMLTYTEVKLELLSDNDQLLMMEVGVRGIPKLKQASMPHAKFLLALQFPQSLYGSHI